MKAIRYRGKIWSPAKMEERKLIRLGNSSFAIALPKDWVIKSGLKKGDKISIVQNSTGELILSSEFRLGVKEKERIINVDNKDFNKIRREFTSAYINGNSIFVFEGKIDKSLSRDIKKIIRDFISCEITEEEKDKIKVKDFFNFEDIDIISFIRRIDNNLREMFGIILAAVEKEKISKKDIEELESIDHDINKFYFLNSRLMTIGLNNPSLMTKLKIDPLRLFKNWWVAFHLEHTGDSFKIIAKRINSGKGKDIKRALMPVLNKLKGKYELSMEVFYNKNREKATEGIEATKKIWEECEELTKSKDPVLSVIGERLGGIDNASYQIIKMISHLEE